MNLKLKNIEFKEVTEYKDNQTKPRRGDVYYPMVQPSGFGEVKRKGGVKVVKEFSPTQTPNGLNLNKHGIYPGPLRSAIPLPHPPY